MSQRKGDKMIAGMGVVGTGIYQKDVIDNVTSTSTNLPLSANQGRILNEKINDLEENSSSANHTHDDRYYTETEIDKKFEDVRVTKEAVTSALGYTPLTETEINNKVSSDISAHNVATNTHADIRNLINGLTTRLNTLADSDDTTLDQMSEIVAYIKNNKTLIENITTSKINVSDIINNLTTNVSSKVLSANQGVVLKGLIDTLENELNSHTNDTSVHITSTERTNWNEAYNQKHTHSNKSILDTITSALINSWNNAVSHISDTVKHITSAERTLWNTVSGKADKSITKSATLLASAWTGTSAPYTLKLTVAEATATNNIEVNPPSNLTTTQRDAICNADIDGGSQGAGYINLIAYDEKPTIDIPVILVIRGD